MFPLILNWKTRGIIKCSTCQLEWCQIFLYYNCGSINFESEKFLIETVIASLNPLLKC